MPFTAMLALLQITLPGEKFAVAEVISTGSGSQSSLACACSMRSKPVAVIDCGGGVALVSVVVQGPVSERSRSAVGDSVFAVVRPARDDPSRPADLLRTTNRARSACPAR